MSKLAKNGKLPEFKDMNHDILKDISKGKVFTTNRGGPTHGATASSKNHTYINTKTDKEED